MKYLLVRSPAELLKNNLIGYGWGQVKFANYNSFKELIAAFKDKNISLGRHTNQIKRFFNIKPGDIVVVPLVKSFAIGRAVGTKSYEKGITNGENRVSVDFVCVDGRILKTPRKSLSNGLESRMRIRMSVADLGQFANELDSIYEAAKGGHYRFESTLIEKEEQQLADFKTKLLHNLQHGKTFLDGGGQGLEELVATLLELDGYNTTIEAKNKLKGVADIDILAERNDRFFAAKLLVQVKHHAGKSSTHAIEQLDAVEDDSATVRCVVTTADFSAKVRDYAHLKNIMLINGNDLVEWISEHLDKLTVEQLRTLGIANLPVVMV